MRRSKKFIIIIAVLLISLSLAGCGEKSNYNKAMDYFNSGDYDNALPIFIELGEYENAPSMVHECRWNILYDYIENKGSKNRDLEVLVTVDYPAMIDYSGELRDHDICLGIDKPDRDSLYLALSDQFEGACIIEYNPSYLLIQVHKGMDQKAAFAFQNYFDDTWCSCMEQASGQLDMKASSTTPIIDTQTYHYNYKYPYKAEYSTNPEDFSPSLLNKYYKCIIDYVPKLLEDSGSGITFKDLGFEKLK